MDKINITPDKINKINSLLEDATDGNILNRRGFFVLDGVCYYMNGDGGIEEYYCDYEELEKATGILIDICNDFLEREVDGTRSYKMINICKKTLENEENGIEKLFEYIIYLINTGDAQLPYYE